MSLNRFTFDKNCRFELENFQNALLDPGSWLSTQCMSCMNTDISRLLADRLSITWSVCSPVGFSSRLSVCLLVCLSVNISVTQSVHLSACLSHRNVSRPK